MSLQIKIFNSENKKVEFLEEKVNQWLTENENLQIINLLTTSNASAVDEYMSEEFYLTVVYKNT